MDNKPMPRIYLASSEIATSIVPDLVNRVALCVTSPPYHNAISYESHQSDPLANYRQRTQVDYANEYLPLLDRVWTQCWKLLKPGGVLAINVGTVLDGGIHFPLPEDIGGQLLNASVQWEFVRSIFWNKVTAGVKRAGSVIQHRLPGYWYPNIMTEHILIVRKPGRSTYLNMDVPPEWLENVWDVAPVPPHTVDHPAPFPEDLPHRIIQMVTKPGEFVVDPFNGAGATTKAAHDLGRVGVGFDLSAKYIETARKRVHEATSVRRSQLLVVPIHADDFVATRSKGQTRHGSGVSARGRKRPS